MYPRQRILSDHRVELAVVVLAAAAILTLAVSGTARARSRQTMSSARRYGRRALAPAYSALARRDLDSDDDRAVRPAGAEAMRDPPEGWSRTDESNDESFPASDPPSTY